MNYDRLIRMGNKIKICVPCLCVERGVPPIRPRKALIKLSNNSVRPYNLDQRKRRQRVLRDLYSYKLYGIYICNYIACWNDYIAAISSI